MSRRFNPYGGFRAATGLIEIENTANLAGGVCTSVEVLEEIWAGARAHKLPLHLDGARIFNAAVALGVDVKTLTRGFDTVMFCLSKGLGAPVGSMLVGSAELIARARVFRKALGGGMRQVGVLAAAGLIALEDGPKRLADDHAQCAPAGRSAGPYRGVSIDLASVETNIVIFRLAAGKGAADLAARLKARGVLVGAFGPDAIRVVTHRDVSRKDCIDAAEALTEEIETGIKTAGINEAGPSLINAGPGEFHKNLRTDSRATGCRPRGGTALQRTLDDGSQFARRAVGGGLLQIGIAALDVGAENLAQSTSKI